MVPSVAPDWLCLGTDCGTNSGASGLNEGPLERKLKSFVEKPEPKAEAELPGVKLGAATLKVGFRKPFLAGCFAAAIVIVAAAAVVVVNGFAPSLRWAKSDVENGEMLVGSLG